MANVVKKLSVSSELAQKMGNEAVAKATHQTAPTQFVEANGIRFAYRRFGNPRGVPLVFSPHYTGTMDYWDPAVTDGLAKNREVILFNNAGVSSSSGQVPTSVQEMAANAIAFIKALGLTKVDFLGWSIGGLIAQEIIPQAGDFVRRLILVGTGPRGADMSTSKIPEVFAGVYDPPEHIWLASLLAVRFKPGRRSRLSGTQACPQGSRSRAERGSGGAARSHPEIFRASRGRSRLSERYPSANAGRERQQRCHGAHGELFCPATEPAERGADPLPGCKSRIVLPVPGALRVASRPVPHIGTARRRCESAVLRTAAVPLRHLGKGISLTQPRQRRHPA